MTRKAVVIADGITKEFLSQEHPFVESRQSVGKAEIDRLLGRGKAYGKGPLPTFLRAVAHMSSASGAQLVMLQDDTPRVEPLEELGELCSVVSYSGDVIPWTMVAEEMARRNIDFGDDVRFLIVGCHTERHVFAWASHLRTALGVTSVAVSPHLTGSATQEAHFAAFRHNLPMAGVEVLLDLNDVADYVGLDRNSLHGLTCGPPRVELPEGGASLGSTERRILELLCLNWTKAEMRPLAGGFSGSLLLLAKGWKGEARTEPMVLKVDKYGQMRRELDGYHQVKDFFGKHVPTFGYPVAQGDSIGVGMELAAMEGSPLTLQAAFEEADSDEKLGRFLRRLDKALRLLSDKLYRNTQEMTWVVPYRAFGMHAEKQATWLVENAKYVLSYLEDDLSLDDRVNPEQLAKLLRLIASNPDGIDSEVCLAHGDLNFANIICDQGDNIWFIDWTHGGFAPVELDFAKVESDAKFVMSKMFDVGDLPKLRVLEEYLLGQHVPADANSLPEDLKFAKWDLRFRKVLETVRSIRLSCFALKGAEDWLVYRVALLRYATHTLSFDQRRDRGECEPTQLMHALYSVQGLIFDLAGDDFHLKIRAERPASYPARQRISIDEAPWMLDCESYAPPHHVDPSVLANDRSRSPGGWADPEEFALVRDVPRITRAKYSDEEGRPRNPRGRTGLAGRGLLGLWGPNLAVAALVLRANPTSGRLEILLGKTEDATTLGVLKGFVLPEEKPEDALRRVLECEAGWKPEGIPAEVVFEGYTYDPRQTDNAWVESQALLVIPPEVPGMLQASGQFDEIRWWSLDAETVNRVSPDQARFIRDSVPRLVEANRMNQDSANRLLMATG